MKNDSPATELSPTVTAREEPPDTRAEWLKRHRLGIDFERVGYLGLGREYNRCLYRLRARHFLRTVRRLRLPVTGRVLEVGMGEGFYLDLYRRLGANNVAACDISPDAVARAKSSFPEFTLETCDIAHGLPESLDDGRGFDVVSAMDVLFHIVRDERFAAALQHCGNAVCPGGWLLISDNFPPATLPPNPHQSFHCMDDYLAVLEPLGFRLVELSPVFFLSNGQVGQGGIGFQLASMHWRIFSRALSWLLRRRPVAGEIAGRLCGGFLTALDALLQHQRAWPGYSTKLALFHR